MFLNRKSLTKPNPNLRKSCKSAGPLFVGSPIKYLLGRLHGYSISNSSLMIWLLSVRAWVCSFFWNYIFCDTLCKKGHKVEKCDFEFEVRGHIRGVFEQRFKINSRSLGTIFVEIEELRVESSKKFILRKMYSKF